MHLDGSGSDVEPPRNELVRQALAQERKHLQLARREVQRRRLAVIGTRARRYKLERGGLPWRLLRTLLQSAEGGQKIGWIHRISVSRSVELDPDANVATGMATVSA